MFFPLSKILGFFALPSNLVIVTGLIGVALLLTRFKRTARVLMVASILLIAILGLSPLGNALIVPLEDRFPRWSGSGDVTGIVLLGGAVTPDVSAARDDLSLNEAAERLTTIARLAAAYPRAKIILSGGDAGLVRNEGAEAPHASRFLRGLGVPPGRLIPEDCSRNTVENAVFSKELAAPKRGERWLLVTSAYHMPRAIGVFRRAGFEVEAYPVDWRTRGKIDALRPFQSVGDGLRRTDTAVREWVGLFVYWLTGRSSELFPEP
ncbi:MAG: YdcF family protein [Xanthobacteraceae bacterium]